MAGGAATPSTTPGQRPPARPGWRGPAPQEAPRHRWQQGGQLGTATLVGTRQWWRVRVAFFFVLAAALLAILVWYLLYAPAQTPVIAVAATNYEWPLPPNAWAREDLQGLADLNNKTLQLADLSAEWRSPERGLARLDAELKRVGQRHRQGQTIIL